MDIDKYICVNNFFDEKGNVRYFHLLFYKLFTIKYISIITNLILFISLIINNNFLIHTIMPLSLSNGIFITILIFLFKRFEERNLKYLFCKKQKDMDKIISFINKHIYKIKTVAILIHFILPFYVYYSNRFIDRKKHCNFIKSLFSCFLLIGIYCFFTHKERYININVEEKNLVYFLSLYMILNIIIIFLYFM